MSISRKARGKVQVTALRNWLTHLEVFDIFAHVYVLSFGAGRSERLERPFVHELVQALIAAHLSRSVVAEE